MDDRLLATHLPALGERGEGWFVAQLALMGIVGLAGVLGPAWGGPARSLALAAGVILVGVAGLLGLRALADLRTSFTPLPHPVEGGQLVEHGVYGIVRHPMYLAVVAGGLGWSLLTASPVSLVATIALFAFFDLKSRREEAWLVQAYAGYGAYRERTHRILPGLY